MKILSFSLKNIGEFTKPFKTDFGWHIVILNDKKILGSLEETEEEITRKINKGSRILLSEHTIKKLKNDYNFSENKLINVRKTNIKSSLDLDKLNNSQLTNNDIKKSIWDNLELFSLDGISFTQKNFKDFIVENQEVGLNFDMLYKRFVDFTCLEYEESKLEEKYPEYKALLNEFRDGILLFDLTSKKVWTKAIEDTVGLQSFYELNSKDYFWNERVQANIYTCANSGVLLKLKRLLKKNKENKIDEILNEINKKNPLSVDFESDKYLFGDNKYVDQVEWNNGIYVVETEDETVVLIEILDVLEEQPKKLSEIKGKVISDYQNYLEKKWLDELRNKYSVTINNDVLYSLIK